MTSQLARRSVLAVAGALLCLVIPVTSAVARPTPTQFSVDMQKALVLKAKSYHLTKAQVNTAFKNATFRSSLYSAGMIICQKLATETPSQAAADLVSLTSTLANSGGSTQGTPLPTPSGTPKLGLTVLKGIVGVGLGVTTAKNGLCPTQHAKAVKTLAIYNKTVGAK